MQLVVALGFLHINASIRRIFRESMLSNTDHIVAVESGGAPCFVWGHEIIARGVVRVAVSWVRNSC